MEFTEDEFTKGMEGLGVDSLEKIKIQLPLLVDSLSDRNTFRGSIELW